MSGPFLGIERVSLGPWRAFDRALERMLVHGGWENVRLVDGPGDGGADLIADAQGKSWIVQCKFRTNQGVFGSGPVEEVLLAHTLYNAEVAIVAVNGRYNSAAQETAERARRNLGIDIRIWDADDLINIGRSLPASPIGRPPLRDYQVEAVDAIWSANLRGSGSALALLATGLGKTRVAAEIIHRWLDSSPGDEVLVLAHTVDLVAQLERALWRYLERDVHTHQLHGSEKPVYAGGVTVATQQSVQASDIAAIHEGRYGLVVVDEAHHAPADGYASVIQVLAPRFLLGLTATPWRGDQRQLAEIFGDPVFTMGIVEGMQRGFLAEIDYRMLMDDIDWQAVPAMTREKMTVRDLNKRLFVPERDESVLEKIVEHMNRLARPKVLVFTRSIVHAEMIAGSLRSLGVDAACIHSRKGRVEIAASLHRFSVLERAALVTVDMLNEGIDLPDANMIVFLRVTHSRRIFIQQLGRGLRLAPGKESVIVLDFVADIRRIAAAIDLNSEAAARVEGGHEPLVLPLSRVVNFEGDSRATFFEQYLADIGHLQDKDDDAVVQFPGGGFEHW
ncbi:MAG: DEAD/DEAH box helicase [Dehalococcoidia bacterium]